MHHLDMHVFVPLSWNLSLWLWFFDCWISISHWNTGVPCKLRIWDFQTGCREMGFFKRKIELISLLEMVLFYWLKYILLLYWLNYILLHIAKLIIMKIDDLYNHSVRIFSFKLFKNMLPSGVSSIFERSSHTQNTREASSNLFVSHSDSRLIKSIAPRVWNLLPPKFKVSPSIASFKGWSKLDLLCPYSGFVCNDRACPSCAVSALAASSVWVRPCVAVGSFPQAFFSLF